MPNFEPHIDIDKNGFKSFGIGMTFDEVTYGELLISLTQPSVDTTAWTPEVKLCPAPEMGMNIVTHNLLVVEPWSDDRAGGYYDQAARIIHVRAGRNIAMVNQSLLFATRRWAGHLSGELASERQEFSTGRRWRIGATIVGAAVLGAAARSITGDGGAIATISLSGLASAKIDEIAGNNTPFSRRCQKYSTERDVLKEFGRIIRYEPLEAT